MYIIKNKVGALLQVDRQIFGSNDLAILWNISNRNTLLKTIERYVKKNILFRIYKGLYSTVPVEKLDKYLLGCAVAGSFSYVSAESVLIDNGIILQEGHAITLFGTKSKNIVIGENRYICRYLNLKYLLNRAGIENRNGYDIATVERAVADIEHINSMYYMDNELSIDRCSVNKLKETLGYHDHT